MRLQSFFLVRSVSAVNGEGRQQVPLRGTPTSCNAAGPKTTSSTNRRMI
jgi:hypothetical protein